MIIERKKIYFSYALFVLLFSLVAVKAFYVQFIHREKLVAYAENQFVREGIIFPKRGNIYDRHGAPLALNIQTYSLFTIPKHTQGELSNFKRLSNIIPDLKLSIIRKKISKRNKYTWIARKIKLSEKQLEEVNKIDDIYVEPESSRFYPNYQLLSQTLGFVGIDNAGLAGLESKFNHVLQGDAQIVRYLKDAKGRPLKFETIRKEGESKDLYLSVDKDLQTVAEVTLKDAVAQFSAIRGGIGVLDAESGEVLAIANYPTFDPNLVPNQGQGRELVNRKLSFVSDPFEPGSIFKVFTVASALENKVARPDTHYFCEYGKLKVEDHIIKEAETTEKFEWLSVGDILKLSSNVGTTKLAFDVTFPTLKKTLQAFNFGQKTGIEIPGESRGIFLDKENVGPLALSNLSFGQGVAVTGIQLLSAYGAIANGGMYVTPTIFRKEGKQVITRTRVMSEQVAGELTKMLIGAVEEGTGKNAIIPYFQIAGKTGTAQRPSSLGGYDGYISSFIGFPVNVNKRFVMLVYIENPHGKYYGNDVAAPAWKKMAQYILYRNKDQKFLAYQTQKYNNLNMNMIKISVTPEREHGNEKIPNFVGLDKLSAQKMAQKFGITLKQIGSGLVKHQNPANGNLPAETKVVELSYEIPKFDH